MSRQCPFPVRSTDNRRCYRTGAAPGFALGLAVVAALSCFGGFSHAAQFTPAEANSPAEISSAVSAIDNQGGPTLPD
jgi:hypothetical protein